MHNKEPPFMNSHTFYHVVQLVILISHTRFAGLERKRLSHHRLLVIKVAESLAKNLAKQSVKEISH